MNFRLNFLIKMVSELELLLPEQKYIEKFRESINKAHIIIDLKIIMPKFTGDFHILEERIKEYRIPFHKSGSDKSVEYLGSSEEIGSYSLRAYQGLWKKDEVLTLSIHKNNEKRVHKDDGKYQIAYDENYKEAKILDSLKVVKEYVDSYVEAYSVEENEEKEEQKQEEPERHFEDVIIS